MSEQLPPDWAIERAATMVRNEQGTEDYDEAVFSVSVIKASTSGFPTTIAFARYIAQHEEAPVDPLMLIARNIMAFVRDCDGLRVYAEDWRSGRNDNSPIAAVVLDALSRAMEIGKAGE